MTNESEAFSALLEVIDRLLGPDGCPWDHEQCLDTLHEDLLEETHEVIEAIEEGDPEKIGEEIGDLLFLVLFLSRLGQRDGVCNTREIVEKTTEKFIQRHPHVFGEEEVRDAQHVLEQWEIWKRKEKSQQERGSLLDGIPKGLPALARAQKMQKKIAKTKYPDSLGRQDTKEAEDKIVNQLLETVRSAAGEGIDAETALLRFLLQEEKKFRSWEREHLPK